MEVAFRVLLWLALWAKGVRASVHVQRALDEKALYLLCQEMPDTVLRSRRVHEQNGQTRARRQSAGLAREYDRVCEESQKLESRLRERDHAREDGGARTRDTGGASSWLSWMGARERAGSKSKDM